MFYCRFVLTNVIYIFQVFYVSTHINGKLIKYLKPLPKKFFFITVLSCFAQRVDEKFIVSITRSDGIVTRRTMCSVVDGTTRIVCYRFTRTIQRKPNLCHIALLISLFPFIASSVVGDISYAFRYVPLSIFRPLHEQIVDRATVE